MIRNLALVMLFATAAHAAEVLDNAAVIRLARAGLSQEIILLKIEQCEARFDTSTDALVELKTAGVADAVIKAMMLKAPRTASPVATPVATPAAVAPAISADTCIKLAFYTLGTNGWEWVPSTACVSATQLTVDEQSFAFSQLTVQCVEPEARIVILGANSTSDATWRFSDGKESFQLRGKPDDVRKLSAALAAAAPAVRHGKCSDSGLRALLRTPAH